jgi:hypothetical protein
VQHACPLRLIVRWGTSSTDTEKRV